MLSVRLLVFLAVAALALRTMQTYLDGCAFGKRAIALVFSLDITQGLFRLGSGADTYPRTLRSLRANTLAPTAPPYIYGSDPLLGYASLNTQSRKIPPVAIPSNGTGRRRNGGTLRGSVPSLLSRNSLPNSNAGPASPLAATPSLELYAINSTHLE